MCEPGVCEWGEDFEQAGYFDQDVPGRPRQRYAGCPARHRPPDIGLWLESFNRWKRWGKTPVEMGLVSAERLDPRYWEAMEVIDWATQTYRKKD